MIMNADCFTHTSEPYYMNQIFNLFGYSYQELRKDKLKNKYSRKKLQEKFNKIKGKGGKKANLELEDYLRNDLLSNYVELNKVKFELNYFHFVAGADEINENITIGFLDIKVLLPTGSYMEDGEYFAIECKRLNKLKGTHNYYVNHGVNRFIERQYYPETSTNMAWMLSFMECEEERHIEDSVNIVKSFNSIMNLKYKENVLHEIGKIPHNLSLDYTVDIYDSTIIRKDKTELQIYHVFLDYYELIEP